MAREYETLKEDLNRQSYRNTHGRESEASKAMSKFLDKTGMP